MNGKRLGQWIVHQPVLISALHRRSSETYENVTFSCDYSKHVDYILVINFEFLEKSNLW